jgi:hypothetical protein
MHNPYYIHTNYRMLHTIPTIQHTASAAFPVRNATLSSLSPTHAPPRPPSSKRCSPFCRLSTMPTAIRRPTANPPP